MIGMDRTLAARTRAREVLLRRTDDKLAKRLREHGWLVVEPEKREIVERAMTAGL